MSSSVEWLILADGAQVMGNKLYVMGGGWDVLSVNRPFPIVQHFAVAVSFLVPWTDTNRRQAMEIELMTEDGASMAKIAGHFEAGRPPNLPAGSDQRTQIAAEFNLEIKGPGVYVVVARIEGKETRRTAFRVVSAAQQ